MAAEQNKFNDDYRNKRREGLIERPASKSSPFLMPPVAASEVENEKLMQASLEKGCFSSGNQALNSYRVYTGLYYEMFIFENY